MNKFFTKIASAVLGLAMAVGVGTVIASNLREVKVAEAAETVEATLSFADKAQRTSFSSSKQVWEQNGITFTNDKSSSTTNVGDYANPARLYASSKVTVEAPGNITKIVFDANNSSYATALKNSIGATASASSDKVTVELDGTSNSYVVAKLTAQVRIDSLTVTYNSSEGEDGGDTPTPEPKYYTVTFFNSDGTIYKEGISVLENEFVTEPDEPIREGFTFIGWYLTGATTAYDFAIPVTSDLNLYAKWKINSTGNGLQSVNNLEDLDAAIETHDVIITTRDKNGEHYLLPSENIGTGTLDAVNCTENIVDDILEIENVSDYLYTLEKIEDDYFIKNKEGQYLYIINDSKGLKTILDYSSIESDITWNINEIEGGYFSLNNNCAIDRYLGVYKSQDWRTYKSTNFNDFNETHTHFQFYLVERTESTPTSVVATYFDGNHIKDYYNGSNNNSKISTDNLIVNVLDQTERTIQTFSEGTGFILEINGETIDATSTAQTYSFEKKEAKEYEITITVPGAGVDGSDLNNSTQEPKLIANVLAKIPLTKGWKEGFDQKTAFYSGVDESKSVLGQPRFTFTDGSYTEAKANFKSKFLNSESQEITELPTKNGKLYVEEDTKYTVVFWHKDFPEENYQLKQDFTIYAATLELTDNYTGKYFTNNENAYTLDFTLKAKYSDNTVHVIEKEEFTLDPQTIQPVTNDPITVTATWNAIDQDGNKVDNYGTATTTIVPVTKGRKLNNLTLSAETIEFTAGEEFNPDIVATLNYVEDGDENEEDLSIDNLIFKNQNSEKILNIGETIKKAYAGTYDVTYYEETLSVSTELTITVKDAVMGGYEITQTTPGTKVFKKVTSAPTDWSGTYLIVYEAGKVAFDGSRTTLDAASNGVTVTINNNEISHTDTLQKNTFDISKSGTSYTIKSASGYYIGYNSNDNGLTSNKETKFNNTISLNGSNVDIKSSGGAYLRYNASSGQNRFRYYKSSSYTNQKAICLYELVETQGTTTTTTDKVAYIKSAIDTYRLNSAEDASICNEFSGIYKTEVWTNIKKYYSEIRTIDEELERLNIQDKYGEVNKTYINTIDNLIAKENPVSGGQLSTLLNRVVEKNNMGIIIVIISLVSVAAIGGYFFLKKRKEQ